MVDSRRRITVVVLVIVVLLAGGGYLLAKIGPIGCAYKAKRLCSGVFVSHRDPATVADEDLGAYRFIDAEIDYREKSVTAHIKGFFKTKAIYRAGLGSTLVVGVTEEELYKQAAGVAVPKMENRAALAWPQGDLVPTSPLSPQIDGAKLAAAVDAAFSEPDSAKPRRTRAIIIVYDGRIIAERYAPGIGRDTPLLGWSMTKSVNCILLGILVRQRRIATGEPAPISEWHTPEDPRGAVTVDQLLRMSSGLRFNEDYVNPLSDVVVMLFAKPDSAAYAAAEPLEVKPDSRWQYSSGTANIIARIIRQTLDENPADYFSFPRRTLFAPLGMQTAVIEPDGTGTFVGSSFMYASARDWARVGLFCLQDGVWNGERILPVGWMKYCRTPTPKAPQGKYGAQFWLNAGTPGKSADRWMPALPPDMFSLWGFEGQYVMIIPSRKLVVVRLGLSQPEGLWNQEGFVAAVLDSIKTP
ncbi:MAG: serine hydrolase [Smithellaceae bacterium]|nr:serine hydrolase [Smithellaceae bacterium]